MTSLISPFVAFNSTLAVEGTKTELPAESLKPKYSPYNKLQKAAHPLG